MNLIINTITKKLVDSFMISNSNVLALVGPTGSGKTYLAQFITSNMLDKDNFKINTIEIDATNSGIDDVRQIQKTLSIKTVGTSKNRRAVIISNFDQFSLEAQNAMLKTLEEPPVDTVIIITINNEHNVLPTIYSRCTKIVVKSVTIKDILKCYPDVNKETVQKASYMSYGYPGLLTSLLNNSDNELIDTINHVKSFLAQQKTSQLSQIEKIIKDRNDHYVNKFLESLAKILYASYKSGIDKNVSLSITGSSLRRYNLVKNAIDQIHAGVNKKLCLTNLIIKF